MKKKGGDFDYAWKNTEVLHRPERLIDSFGSTCFHFCLITELMDSVGEIRVRRGELTTNRPQIITPSVRQSNLEGFGKEAEKMLQWLEKNKMHLSVLRYGFSFSREVLSEEILKKDVENFCEEMRKRVLRSGNPLKAVIRGVDDSWEISLLRFAIDMIENSTDFNMHDFKRKGLL